MLNFIMMKKKMKLQMKNQVFNKVNGRVGEAFKAGLQLKK